MANKTLAAAAIALATAAAWRFRHRTTALYRNFPLSPHWATQRAAAEHRDKDKADQDKIRGQGGDG